MPQARARDGVDPMRSRGSVAYRAVGGNTAAHAEHCGVSTSTVVAWRNGHRRPGTKQQRTLIRSIPGCEHIEQAWWDQPPPQVDFAASASPGAAPSAPLEHATPEAVIAEADKLLDYARKLQAEAMSPGALEGVADRARVLATLSSVVVDLGRLTGVGIKLSMRQILASPDWNIIENAIVEALEQWPEAMRAVAAKFEELKL